MNLENFLADSKIIAITGGIASGKSLVAEIVKQKGYTVIQSDLVASNLMNKDKSLIARLKKEFGDEFYADEKVNKEYVSNLIFGESEENERNREKLDSIVHPAVIEANIKQIDELIETGEKMIFIESALVFEAGLEKGYDYIVCVYASPETALKRLTSRSGISEKQAKYRLASQLSPEHKKGHSDFVIDNEKGVDELTKSTELILSILESLPARNPDEKDS